MPTAARQHRARNAEEFEELGRPFAREGRPEERPRRGRGVGEAGALLEQPVQQIARERTRAQARLRRCAADFRQVIEAPAQLARAVVRRQLQAGQARDVVGAAREAAQPRGIARVLPGNDGRERAAVVRAPAHEARALDREAGGRPALRRDDARELGKGRPDARDDLLRVVLDMAEGVALRRHRDECGALELACGGVRARARRVPALVDRDEDLVRHAGSGSLDASSPASRKGVIDSTIATPRPASSSAWRASVTS